MSAPRSGGDAARSEIIEPVTSAGAGGGLAIEVNPPLETPLPVRGVPTAAIIGRSPGQLAWLRLTGDRTAMVSLGVLIFFALMVIAAPLIEWLYGYSPTKQNSDLLNDTGYPVGYAGGIDFTTDNPSHHIHILGVEPGIGRDIFMQLVYGVRTSLLIAFTAVLLSTTLGVVLGVVAGYFGGMIDSVISWVVDFMLAFPFFLFALAFIPVINTRLADASGDVASWKRVMTIIFVFAGFGWMYTARLVRGQVLSLREREYVEAARAAAAGPSHILFRQLLPNIWAPILITFSLSVPITITGEAALSFLNIGVIEPTPDFGRMIYASISWFKTDPAFMLIPGIAIFILVLAFNLFGDALRDSLDPKSTK